MSLSAHRKSMYRLRKLPRCSKCKCEFIFTYAKYDQDNEIYKEWECPKCHKVVAYNLLKEDRASPDDEFLHQWCKREALRQKHKR